MSPRCRAFLVRHGQAAMPDAAGRVFNYSAAPLTETGRRQAGATGALLREAGIEAVFSSDLARAEQTARLVAGGAMPVRVDPRLREIDIGDFEGMTLPRLRRESPRHLPWLEVAFGGRYAGSGFHVPHDLAFPGGESVEAAHRRALPAFQDVCRAWAGRAVAVVTHAWIIQALVAHAVGAGLANYHRFTYANSALTLVEADVQGLGRLRTLNANVPFDAVTGGRLGGPGEGGDRASTCRAFLLDREPGPALAALTALGAARLDGVFTSPERNGAGARREPGLAAPETAPADFARTVAAHLGGAIAVCAPAAALEAIAWRVVGADPVPARMEVAPGAIALAEVEADGRGALHVFNAPAARSASSPAS